MQQAVQPPIQPSSQKVVQKPVEHPIQKKIQKPREKLLEKGAGALTDIELLSLFLRTGLPGLHVGQLAERLLQRFDGLAGLMLADAEDLLRCEGIGAAKCAALCAAMEMTCRAIETSLRRGDAFTDPSATRQYVAIKMRSYTREVFACLFLDNQHRLISYEELFFGTIDGASVHPREVVKRSLETNAAAVIFAHNHPSGVAEPSQADRRITARLESALSLVDIRVLDHMVVGDGEVVSFAERGLLSG
ncbi:MAG: DNA repair protein RadC [Candidatus Azotimanducaceae bacterium]|jgi:DNA repair protein RadC